MASLVTVEDARIQLRWTHNDMSLRLGELETLIEQASEIVLAHCGTTDYWRAITPTWDETTVPATVKTAVLKQVAYLNQYRGDEPKGSQEDDGLAPGVRSLLWFTRDPVII